MVVPDFGESGQTKLKSSIVVVVGCGGLGALAAEYLCRAGVGKLVLIDDDEVSLTNLHRQVIFRETDLGSKKADVLCSELKRINSEVEIEYALVRMDASNLEKYIPQNSIVLECSDNFETKYLLNDFCVSNGLMMVYGAVNRMEGQISVFNVPFTNGRSGNLRNCFREPISPNDFGNCEINGVLGPAAGVVASWMALECVKLITSVGEILANKLLTIDMASNRTFVLKYGDEIQINKGRDAQSITWEEIRTHPQRDRFVFYDMRTDAEIAEKSGPGIKIEMSDAKTLELEENQIAVFYCASGIRAKVALEEFKIHHQNREAFFVNDRL